MSKHYVNNKTLYTEMIKYRDLTLIAKSQNKSLPRVSNYIGEAILLICNRLSYKPNFINYSYKEEMIADGIENCIRAIDNFDPDKSNNPFAYFTQIAYNAFIRRIDKEKKQTYIKHKNFENAFIMEEINMSLEHSSNMNITNEYSSQIISSFEEKKLNEKTKKKLIGLEKFIKDDNS